MSSTEEIYKKKQKFDSAELIERLSVIMEKDEIFKDVSLTIEGLAEMLHTNRTYLSQYIKSVYGMTFRDWISDLRIEYAKRLMLQQPQFRVVDISESSGFLSLSHFTHTFTSKEGCSPSKWRNKNIVRSC